MTRSKQSSVPAHQRNLHKSSPSDLGGTSFFAPPSSPSGEHSRSRVANILRSAGQDSSERTTDHLGTGGEAELSRRRNGNARDRMLGCRPNSQRMQKWRFTHSFAAGDRCDRVFRCKEVPVEFRWYIRGGWNFISRGVGC